MEAELMAARENIDQLTQPSQESKVGTYPEDTIKRMETKAETEKPKEEILEKVRSLSTGTELKGTELAKLIKIDPSYLSKYKSGKINPPAWFWDNFEAIGEGSKSRWVKK
jgi:DNA-binding transcriptional regulator YiaG